MIILVIKKLSFFGLMLLLLLASCGKDNTSVTAFSPSNEPSGEAEQQPGQEESDPGIKELKLHFQVEHRYRWSDKFSESLFRYLDHPELSVLYQNELNPRDLRLLKCEGYKEASVLERKRFWVTFMASIAHAESGLNPMTTYREKDGTLSSGLLQIDLASANRHSTAYTGYKFIQKDLFNTDLNLMAGLYVMKHQLEGGIFDERPDIKGRLFTDRSYYWSVLTLKRELIIKTFTKNAQSNLSFC